MHGADGLDEITTTGPSFVAEIKGGKLTSFEVTPEDAGLPRSNPEQLRGGEAALNAAALRALLDGMPGPYRDVVLMNAGAALVVAGKAKNIREGVALGIKALDIGAANTRLDKLITVSNA